MKKNILAFLCLLCTIYLSLFAQHTVTVHFAIEVNNQWNRAKMDETVTFRTECILAYGPIRTIVDVEAKDWEYQGSDLTMTQHYILYAGHRDLRAETFFTESLMEEIFCIGVQNVMGMRPFLIPIIKA